MKQLFFLLALPLFLLAQYQIPIWILNGDKALAGEITVIYPPGAAQISLTPAQPWQTQVVEDKAGLLRAFFYRLPTAPAAYNSTVASLRADLKAASVDITVEVKAAQVVDGQAVDIYQDRRTYSLPPSTPAAETSEATVMPRPSARSSPSSAPPPVITVAVTQPGWMLAALAAVAVAAAVGAAAAALLLRGRGAPPYLIVGELGSLRVAKVSKVFRRADFEGILAPDKLAYISREGQFKIEYIGGVYYLTNLSTKNVTHVNGVPALRPTPLKSGDEIQISHVKLKFIAD